MAKKPWSEVEQNPAYQQLSPEKKQEAQQYYFDNFVYPDTPDDQVASARESFMRAANPTLTDKAVDLGGRAINAAARAGINFITDDEYGALSKPGAVDAPLAPTVKALPGSVMEGMDGTRATAPSSAGAQEAARRALAPEPVLDKDITAERDRIAVADMQERGWVGEDGKTTSGGMIAKTIAERGLGLGQAAAFTGLPGTDTEELDNRENIAHLLEQRKKSDDTVGTAAYSMLNGETDRAFDYLKENAAAGALDAAISTLGIFMKPLRLPSIVVQGASEGGNTYRASLDAGMSEEAALGRGAFQAITASLTELVGFAGADLLLGKLAKMAPKAQEALYKRAIASASKAVATAGAVSFDEGGEEVFNSIANDLADQYGFSKLDMTEQARANMQNPDILGNASESFVGGALGGAVTSPVAAAGSLMQDAAILDAERSINATLNTDQHSRLNDEQLNGMRGMADQVNQAKPGAVDVGRIDAEIERRASLGTLERAAEAGSREAINAEELYGAEVAQQPAGASYAGGDLTPVNVQGGTPFTAAHFAQQGIGNVEQATQQPTVLAQSPHVAPGDNGVGGVANLPNQPDAGQGAGRIADSAGAPDASGGSGLPDVAGTQGADAVTAAKVGDIVDMGGAQFRKTASGFERVDVDVLETSPVEDQIQANVSDKVAPLHVAKNADTGMEAHVVPGDGGKFNVVQQDSESGEYVPTVRIFDDKAKAIAYAETINPVPAAAEPAPAATGDAGKHRATVEQIISHRAAAAQLGAGRAFDKALESAKKVMAGERVKSGVFKKFAETFKKHKPLAGLMTNLAEDQGAQEQFERSAKAKSVAAARKRIDPATDSLTDAIAKLDGVNMDEAMAEFGFDRADLGRFKVGVWRTFSNGASAKSVDGMREALRQYGYPVGDTVREFGDALDRAVRGESVLSDAGVDNDIQAQIAAYEESFAAEPDAVQDVVDEAFGDDFQGEGVTLYTDDDIERMFGYVGTTQPEGAGEGGQTAARAEEAGAGTDHDARQDRTGEAEDFTLAGQTQQQVAAAERAAEDRSNAEAEAARKGKADDQRNDFTLTGSNRDADQAAARGARDLFDQPAAQDTPVPDRQQFTKDGITITVAKTKYTENEWGVSYASTDVASATSREDAVAIANRVLDSGAQTIAEMRAAAKKPAASVSTAPEHAAVGVDDRELGEIVVEFNDAHSSMVDGDDQVHHLFDAPAKSDVVRLSKNAGITESVDNGKKVYHRDAGWMTPEEAKAHIAQWKEHAAGQYDNDKTRSENSQRIVLSLFDLTGSWSKPWEEAGYQVYRFDIQSNEMNEVGGKEINVGDINNFGTEYFNDLFGSFDGLDVYAILAATPCTDFAVSGSRHFAAKDADGRTVASVKLVHMTLATIEHFKPSVWAIENPVGRIEKLGGLPPWRLSFEPFHLGDTYTKKTLLWGRFNGDLPIAPVEPTEGSKMHSQYGGKSLATKNARSATPEGFSYGFFMANNAADHPVLEIAGKYDRLDRDLIQKAVDSGVTKDEIDAAVEDFYYMDLDDAAANDAIRGLIKPAPKGGKDLAPGTRVNGDIERKAADRLELLVAKMEETNDLSFSKRNEPHTQAKVDVRNVIEHLRKPRTVASIVEILETASQRLMRQHAPFSEVIDEVIETLSQPSAKEEAQPAKPEGAREVTSETARRGEYKLKSGATAKVLEHADRGRFSVNVDGESYGTFSMDDEGTVSREAARANWAMDDVRDAAGQFAAEHRKPSLSSKASSQFSDNKVFTADKVEAARARLKAKLGTLNSGLDPELLIDGMTIAGGYIELGVRGFSAYAKAMSDDFGDKVKPYLLSFYEAARAYPGIAKDGMTSAEDAAVLHQALLTPDVKETIKEVMGEGVTKAKKAKAKANGQMMLTQDWGVDHIDGWTESSTGKNQGSDFGLVDGIKDQFLEETKKYLTQVAGLLTAEGYAPYADRKGKPGKAVNVNKSGTAVSGDVSLTMRRGNVGVYVTIGESSLRGMVGNHPQGVAMMMRTTRNADRDQYANQGTNTWMAPDISATELANVLAERGAQQISLASQDQQDYGKKNETGKESQNANPLQAESVPGSDPDSDSAVGRNGDRAGESLDVGLAGNGEQTSGGQRVPGRVPGSSGTGAGRTGRSDGQQAPDAHGNRGNGGAVDAAADDQLDHTIEDADEIGAGGLAKKYRDNVAAIKIIKAIESEGRNATPEERKQLARYVGWGALKSVFDKASKQWAKQHAELKALLTADEWKSAMASVLNAHFTAPVVVKAMYSAVDRLGFKGGRVLEPSMGSGNFFGMMPAGLRNNSTLHGVELDNLTSRLARALYPKAIIATSTGFQEYQVPNGYFDMAIGNPPFGSEPIVDKERNAYSGFSIHNYFVARMIDKVRDGGIVPVIVSHNFMDAISPKAREWIAERANLIAAVRLPNTAFQENAGTDVVTDILFFQKTATPEKSPAWVDVTDIDITNPKTDEKATAGVNNYFIANPRNVLGKHSAAGTMRRANEYTVEATGNIDEQLAEFISRLPAGIYQSVERPVEELNSADSTVPDGVKPGSFYLNDKGEVRQRGNDVAGMMMSQPWTAKNDGELRRMKGMIRLREWMREQMRLERSDASTHQIETHRKSLNKFYDDFVKANGYVNSQTNRRVFNDDTESSLVQALEFDYDAGVTKAKAESSGMEEKEPSAGKADILSRRMLFPPSEVMNVSSAKDALLASLNIKGRLDLAYMQEVYAKSESEIVDELGDVVFQDPQQGYVTADEYLSGDVKTKLAEAKAAAEGDRSYARNVAALEKVIPADKMPSEIYAAIGAGWIPADIYNKFAKEITGSDSVHVGYLAATAQWFGEIDGRSDAGKMESEFGTSHVTAFEIFKLMLNGKPVEVKKRVSDGSGGYRYVTDEEATEAARSRLDKIKSLWESWVWGDGERSTLLADIFNNKHNRTVPRHFDGAHMTLPGASPAIPMRAHQNDAIWRAVQERNVLLDHVVGAGKTYAMVGTVMEMRRLGIARKPLFAVPNHLTMQWRSDFSRLYPASNVLAATPEDFSKGNRERMFAKIATGDYDAVVIGHSSLKKIGLDPEIEQRMYQEQIDEIADAIEDMKRERGDRGIVRDMEKIKANLDAKVQDLINKAGERDKVVTFDELGIDALFIDEMHEFKNLFFMTQKQRVSGLGNPKGSGKAFDLFMKVRWMQQTMGEKVPFVTATGTPISNSLSEMFTMQRYMRFDELRRDGLHLFDAWSRTYGEDEYVYEVAPSGVGYRISQRFSKFKNLPSLMAHYQSFADVITLQDLKDQAKAEGKRFPVPKIQGGRQSIIVAKRSDLQRDFFGVPFIRKDDAGNTEYMADPENAKIEQNAEGRWVLNAGSYMQMHDTREDAELDLVEQSMTPILDIDPDSLVGQFNNLAALTRATKGKINALSLTGLASKAGLDYRLIDPSAPDFAGSKINMAVDNMVRIYGEWAKDKGTQLVFCDLSIPNSARASAAAKDKRLYVLDDKGMLTHKKGTLHTVEGREGFPFYLVRDGKGDKARVTAYEPVSGAVIGRNFMDKTAAKEWVTAGLSTDAGRDRWFDLRDKHEPITPERIAEYRDENELEVEDDGSNEISMDDLEAIAGSSKFSVYDDIKAKLIKRGVRENEIAFIHDYNTPKQKQDLFKRVKAGDIRFLFGSTPKLGAGTNVQERLVGLHHIDAPWRPSDLEQREGRIIRQGNALYERDPDGFEVFIGRYATEQTYDTRRWQLLEHKAAGIEQLRKYSGEAEIEDVSSEAANAADMKAAASGNPLILEETRLRRDAGTYWPQVVEEVGRLTEIAARHPIPLDKKAVATIAIDGKKAGDREHAETLVGELAKKVRNNADDDYTKTILYRGIEFTLERSTVIGSFSLSSPIGRMAYYGKDEAASPSGMLTRFNNWIDNLESRKQDALASIAAAKEDIASIEKHIDAPFEDSALLEETKGKHGEIQRALMKATQMDAVPAAERAAFMKELDSRKKLLISLGYEKAVKESDRSAAAFSRKSAQADTPQFKRWFGDSKVVDADGKPLVVYHGTHVRETREGELKGDVYVFDRLFTTKFRKPSIDTLGSWFSTTADEGGAGMYAGGSDGTVIYPIYLSIKNPHTTTFHLMLRRARLLANGKDDGRMIGAAEVDAYRKWLSDMGKDGVRIVHDDGAENGSTEFMNQDAWIALEPTQIKSAVGNNGQFDPANPDISMSRGTGAGLTKKAVQAIVDALRAKWKNAPQIVVVEDMDDPRIRKAVRDENQRQLSQGAAGQPEGFFDAGKVYIVASEMNAPQDVVRVLLHESLGHYGLRGLFGTELQAILKQIALLRRKEVLAKAEQYGLDPAVERDMLAAAEEVLAEMAQTNPQLGFVKRAIAAIRSWLRNTFPQVFDGMKLTDAEIISAYLEPARAYVKDQAAERGEESEQTAAFSRSAPQAGNASPASAQGGLLDRALQIPGKVVAKRITQPAYRAAARLLDSKYMLGNRTGSIIKAGMIADYGLDMAYMDRRDEIEARMNAHLRRGKKLIQNLAGLSREESRVAYQWLQEKPDTELEHELMAQLPKGSREYLDSIKQMIEDMSQDAIDLKQLTPEQYERNKFAYLHRSYATHELNTEEGQRRASNSRRILGDQYKGRGLQFLVDPARLDSGGENIPVEKGQKYIRLERREDDGRVTKRIWWNAARPVPPIYGDMEADPVEWEVRGDKGGKIVMWRDFTKEERTRMGELDEAKFAVATTVSKMAHDIEIGKFFAWVDTEYAQDEPPEDAEVVDNASESAWSKGNLVDALAADAWVKVPDVKIPGTSVPKYGDLAGKFIPGAIWNDIRQIATPPSVPKWYQTIMRYWKIAKTALSPAVHTNNVMANIVMADMHDVQAKHVVRALNIMVANALKAGAVGVTHAEAQAFVERFEDSGAIAGTFVHAELKDAMIKPLLEELRKELTGTQSAGDQMFSVANAIAMIFGQREVRKGMTALAHTTPGKWAAKLPEVMVDMYQAEDVLFRLAAFIKETERGATDREAGKFARKSFLDYRINAPWVQAARHTVLPFVAFTYRMIPMYVETMRDKPWKMAKYALVANALAAVGMALSGIGDDEDEEIQKLLPDDRKGVTPYLTQRQIPVARSADGKPIYLDVTRWMPLGDIFEVRGEASNVLPLPGFIYPSGVIMLAGEAFANRSFFSGRDIWQSTDTTAEMSGKLFDHIYKGMAPNFPALPNTYSWEKVSNAVNGKTDQMGREYSVGQAAASAFGIKLNTYDTDLLRYQAGRKVQNDIEEIRGNIYRASRDASRKGITEQELEETVEGEAEKLRGVAEDYREKMN